MQQFGLSCITQHMQSHSHFRLPLMSLHEPAASIWILCIASSATPVLSSICHLTCIRYGLYADAVLDGYLMDPIKLSYPFYLVAKATVSFCAPFESDTH